LRQSGEAAAHRNPGEQCNSHRFPYQQPECHAQADGRALATLELPQPERHTGIGQCKEGHDAERDHSMKSVLQPEEGGLQLLGQALELLNRRLVFGILEGRGAGLVRNLEP
jgi:hypothetical protein